MVRNRLVRDLMLPLRDYAVVPRDASLREALLALQRSQERLGPDRPRHRAVLVADGRGRIVGKVGQLDFLRALEPGHAALDGDGSLARAGVDEEFFESLLQSCRFWQDDMAVLCRRAREITAERAMRPIEAGIEEDRSLTEAMHRMIVRQSLSLLVTSRGGATGILRLSDVFREVAEQVTAPGEDCE